MLPKGVYSWKISDRFTAGIPDSYYSGNKGDLWVEYKFEQKVPATAKRHARLSALQKTWLKERHLEGRNVAVVIGFSDGKAGILHGSRTHDPINPQELVSHLDVVNFISGQTCEA